MAAPAPVAASAGMKSAPSTDETETAKPSRVVPARNRRAERALPGADAGADPSFRRLLLGLIVCMAVVTALALTAAGPPA